MSPQPLWLVKTTLYFNYFVELTVAAVSILGLIACAIQGRPDAACFIFAVFAAGIAFDTALDPSYKKEMRKEMRLATA